MEALSEAMRVKDVEAVVACMRADVELRSPISHRVVFRGRDQVRDVLEVVYATLGPIEAEHTSQRSLLTIAGMGLLRRHARRDCDPQRPAQRPAALAGRSDHALQGVPGAPGDGTGCTPQATCSTAPGSPSPRSEP